MCAAMSENHQSRVAKFLVRIQDHRPSQTFRTQDTRDENPFQTCVEALIGLGFRV